MKSLLLICPTRERPELFRRMLESMRETATQEILLLGIIDADEPKSEEYDLIYPMTVTTEGVTDAINRAFRMFPGFDAYSVTNDDFIYMTKGWDEILMEAAGDWGIAYGDDTSGTKIPSTSVVGGKLAKTLGWLQLPELKHLCGDVTMRHLGEQLKCLKYCPEVITEHCHYLNKKSDKALYSRTNHPDVYDHDQKVFRSWRDNQCKKDIERIKNERAKEENNKQEKQRLSRSVV